MTASATIPRTMKAVVLTGHGGLEKLVYRTDVKVPTPAKGEVLIEVSACGMNNTDVCVTETVRLPVIVSPALLTGV